MAWRPCTIANPASSAPRSTPGSRSTPTLIADGVHVHPAVLAMVFAATTPILVSDAVATGIAYFGQEVTARNGAAFLGDGTLVGAVSSPRRGGAHRGAGRCPAG